LMNKSAGRIPFLVPVPSILIDYSDKSEENLMKMKMIVVREKRPLKLVRPFHGIYHRSDERLDDGRIGDRLLGIECSFLWLRKLENRRNCTIYRRICFCRMQCSGLLQDLQSGYRRHLIISSAIKEAQKQAHKDHILVARLKVRYHISDIPHHSNLVIWLYVSHRLSLPDQVLRQGS
jgi:hypothetical protein